MTFEIIWSDFAERQLDLTFIYYLENARKSTAVKLVREIIYEPNRLRKDPYVGQQEELLQNRRIVYRYLIIKNFKITYSVDEINRFVMVADVFHTRQEPSKIYRND